MEKIQFDSGLRAYKLGNGGVLRFNPGDPNVYARFMEAEDKFRQIEKDLVAEAQTVPGEDVGTAALLLMQKADKDMKELLAWVFGKHNDFQELLQGVNLLAVADNGERIITNLLVALQPVLVAGARRCAGEAAQAAVKKAENRRQSQC